MEYFVIAIRPITGYVIFLEINFEYLVAQFQLSVSQAQSTLSEPHFEFLLAQMT